MRVKIAFVLLLSVAYATARPEDMEFNDINDDDRTSRSDKDVQDYDPSLLDEILGPDYFEQMDNPAKKEDTRIINTEQSTGETEVVTEKAYCLGCDTNVNIEDPKIKDIAMFAFNEYAAAYDGADDNDTAQTFVKVTKAKTQVVAGQKYTVNIDAGYLNCTKKEFAANPDQCVVDPTKENFDCVFEVLEQAWRGHKEVLSSVCHDTKYQDFEDSVTENEPEVTVMSRRKRDLVAVDEEPSERTNSVGKLREADEDDEYLRSMANYALEQLDEIDADNEARLLVDVLAVKKQTVSGWLYHLKLRVAQTSCEEGKGKTLNDCRSQIQLPFNICNVKVLVQPWQTVTKKVTESQCFPEKMKSSKKLARKLFPEDKFLMKKQRAEEKKLRKEMKKQQREGLIGGPKTVDANSTEIQNLMEWAIESVDAQSNALHAQRVVEVINAERQVVNGILSKITFETGYTTCRKSKGLDRSKCELDGEREHNFCEMHVWEKPWLKEKQVTYSKCGKREEIVKRKKRSLIGGDDHDIRGHEIAMFGEFLKTHNKKYDTPEEYKYRLGIFRDNMKKVKLLQENEQGTATYGATVFADLTEEEFAERHLGLRPDLRQRGKTKKAKIPQLRKLPDEFDWRNYNAVTPVKNQGSCGSCWAFSVTGNIEGLYARKYQQLEQFSEQELVDCDTLDEGCGGGLPENAYKAIQKLGGLETESAYPYDGKNEKCHFKSDLAKAQVTGFVEVSKNETEMAAWLVKNGPISIGINANAMQFYFGGVSHPFKILCSPKQLDHGVLIVGYGVHNYPMFNRTLPYWTVKNSWGERWGEQGYYRVYRGDGTCGVNQMATSAVIA